MINRSNGSPAKVKIITKKHYFHSTVQNIATQNSTASTRPKQRAHPGVSICIITPWDPVFLSTRNSNNKLICRGPTFTPMNTNHYPIHTHYTKKKNKLINSENASFLFTAECIQQGSPKLPAIRVREIAVNLFRVGNANAAHSGHWEKFRLWENYFIWV